MTTAEATLEAAVPEGGTQAVEVTETAEVLISMKDSTTPTSEPTKVSQTTAEEVVTTWAEVAAMVGDITAVEDVVTDIMAVVIATTTAAMIGAVTMAAAKTAEVRTKVVATSPEDIVVDILAP
jgi:hypothetical protein